MGSDCLSDPKKNSSITWWLPFSLKNSSDLKVSNIRNGILRPKDQISLWLTASAVLLQQLWRAPVGYLTFFQYLVRVLAQKTNIENHTAAHVPLWIDIEVYHNLFAVKRIYQLGKMS